MNPVIRQTLEEIVDLGLDDVTSWAHVRMGTETAREVLNAIDTLAAVRALLASGSVSTHALAALLSASTVETGQIVQRERV